MNRIFFLTLFFLAACSPGGSSKPGQKLANAGELTEAERGEIVAKIGDKALTLQAFEESLSNQSPFVRARYNSLERKREYLDGMIRFELLAREAQAQGFDQHPEVVLAQRQAMVRLLTSQILQKAAQEDAISEEEIAKYYQDHIDEYQPPPELEVGQIRLPSKEEAADLRAELVSALGQQPLEEKIKIFSQFALLHSTDATTKERGGRMGILPPWPQNEPADQTTKSRRPGLKAITEAAYALKTDGDLSEPIESPEGFHLVMRQGERQGYHRTLDQMRPAIRTKLIRQHKLDVMLAHVAELRAKAQVQIDENLLEKAAAHPHQAPSALPAVPDDITGISH